MVNPKLHKNLTEIAAKSPEAVFRYRYLDWDSGGFTLPCKMLDYRIDNVCNDHSIQQVQVREVPGGEWGTLYPD